MTNVCTTILTLESCIVKYNVVRNMGHSVHNLYFNFEMFILFYYVPEITALNIADGFCPLYFQFSIKRRKGLD